MGDEKSVDEGQKLDNGEDKANIRSSATNQPSWDGADARKSLDQLYAFVLGESKRSEDWYWKNKRKKAWGSHAIQWTVVALSGLAAVIPIARQLGLAPEFGAWLAKNVIKNVDSGLIASFFIGIAAALIAFDRSSGLSSGWARYVLTGTAIRSASEEFRMDWTALRAQLSEPPTPEQILALIQRAKTFRLAVEGLVTKETQEWATEFKNNLAQMEKELKEQVDHARAAREKAEQDAKAMAAKEKELAEQRQAAREAAQAPGAIEATITNAIETDGFRFEAVLENDKGVVTRESISSSQTWAGIGVLPGQYRLIIRAEMKKRPSARMSVIVVKPGETSAVEVTLPAAPP